jgi:N-sulfoglucosamine sulfohydrolase
MMKTDWYRRLEQMEPGMELMKLCYLYRMKNIIIFLLLISPGLLNTGCNPGINESAEGEKPNILWITCEDITPMLGSYGDPQANTPNLDRLAENGIRFNHAYSTAAVCSPARSCLVTGIYANSMGTQNLRSDFDIPDKIRTVPHILRENGYYCSNNDKEDYNFEDPTIWDESGKKAHWRNRPAGKPFFSVFNIETTHQSQIFGNNDEFYEKYQRLLDHSLRQNPDSIRLPAYYLDSEEVRKLWARYYDLVTLMDRQVQEILNALQRDGLTENTIIFFFSDHGTGMPRSKRALYRSGIQVPFIVYLPENFRQLSNYQTGSDVNNLVSFVDFAPTVLSIAGIEPPEYMQGNPFMGIKKVSMREYAFATSDRVDEAFELSRTVKNTRYSYIRNFLPHYPLIQPNFYSDQSEIMKELYRLKKTTDMNKAQQSMWLPRRHPEELYDIESDPEETDNLADDPRYVNVLEEMRTQLKQWLISIRDTGFMPEGYMMEHATGQTAYEMKNTEEIFPLARILEINDLILQTPIDQSALTDNLDDPQELIRFWAVVSLQYVKEPTVETIRALEEKLTDPSRFVKLAASDALCSYGQCMPEAQAVILKSLQSPDDALVLQAARVFELNRKKATRIADDVRKIHEELKQETREQWKGYRLYATWALNEAFK